ncbi:5831_t:CDS:1, partial [Dentiscutata heterogama]
MLLIFDLFESRTSNQSTDSSTSFVGVSIVNDSGFTVSTHENSNNNYNYNFGGIEYFVNNDRKKIKSIV